MKPDTITRIKWTLPVTNNLPPRKEGIQTYLGSFARELDSNSLVVYCSSPPDDGMDEYDATQPWTTIHCLGMVMLPIPGVRREMQRIIREQSVEAIWFDASTPLDLMAKAARAAGAGKIISTTHGHEVGWVRVPAGRLALRKIFHDADIITYLTKAILRRLRPLIGNMRIIRLPGGISLENFALSASWRHKLRARYGIGGEPTVVYTPRLIERKGQDTLTRVWPRVLASSPRARLVTIGKDPYQGGLWEVAQESPTAANIVFTDEVPFEELAAHYSLGDASTMPCRIRTAGMDLERLGIVYLEACATGLPVIAEDSGGAPKAVINGETGVVCSGHHPTTVVSVLTYILGNPSRAKEMGHSGLAWVNEGWRWSTLATPLQEELLAESQKQVLRPGY